MNSRSNIATACALAFTLACGCAFAQSTGGGNAGGGSASQAQGSANGRTGDRGGANASGYAGSTTGGNAGGNRMGGADCSNQAGVATANRVSPENAPPGTPVRGAASHGSTDWSSTNCIHPPKGNGQQPTRGHDGGG